MAAIGEPTSLSHQETGGIVPWLRRASMIDRGWNLPFLENFIFRIPRKNEEGMIGYLREDRQDGLDVFALRRMKYFLNVPKS
jgi:hypothetical protein